MKNKVSYLLIVVGLIFFLGACSEKKEESYSDDKFLSSLAKGLEKRWDYSEKNVSTEMSDEDYVNSLKEATNIELKKLEEYSNSKFKDSKLQESALSYINELKNANDVLEDYGSKDFIFKWDEHYSERTKQIVHLTETYDVPISDKYEKTLKELKAHGNEVIDKEVNDKALNELINNLSFEQIDSEYQSDYKQYSATQANTIGYDINTMSATLNLLDSEGVIVDTQYINANNWKKDQKIKFEFMTNKPFEKIDASISYYDVK